MGTQENIGVMGMVGGVHAKLTNRDSGFIADVPSKSELLEWKSLLHTTLSATAASATQWFDIFLCFALSAPLSSEFFPGAKPGLRLFSFFTAFACSFLARPLGALYFGKRGDTLGRNSAHLRSILITAIATALIALLPGYGKIYFFAPFAFFLLRSAQNFAIGGDYAGASIYVAETAPNSYRGFFTAIAHAGILLGLAGAIAIVLFAQLVFSEDLFKSWAWRVPFLLSSALSFLAYFARKKTPETQPFAELQNEGRISRRPILDCLAQKENRRMILFTIFGLTAGQGALQYTSLLYSWHFLHSILHVNRTTANTAVLLAVLLCIPLYPILGTISDRIGRKRIMQGGLLLAFLIYLPTYMMLVRASGFYAGNPFEEVVADLPMLIMLLLIQMLPLALVSAPLTAFLAERFPTRLRFSSASLAYQIGNGVFGGFVPFAALGLSSATGSMYIGLLYTMLVAIVTFTIGGLFLHDRVGKPLLEKARRAPTL